MEQVCLILDIQGFQLGPDSGSEFLVRELGLCPAHHRMNSQCVHVDNEYPWRRLYKNEKVCIAQVLRLRSGLAFCPCVVERYIVASALPEYVRVYHSMQRTESKQTLAHWNNRHVELFAKQLNLRALDLSLYSCPPPGNLIISQAKGHRCTCGQHNHINSSLLCECAEETAFNLAEWLARKSQAWRAACPFISSRCINAPLDDMGCTNEW